MKYIKASFINVPISGLVDTGSTVFIIKRSFVKSRGLEEFLVGTKKIITVAEGRRKVLHHKLEGQLYTKDFSVYASFYVTDDLPVEVQIGCI